MKKIINSEKMYYVIAFFILGVFMTMFGLMIYTYYTGGNFIVHPTIR